MGDTLTIVRRIVAPLGAVIDARAPADSTVATLVAPPAIAREGDSVRISYTVALWASGHNDLVLPGAIVVDAAGRVDTLADAHLPVDVASVLPVVKNAAAIAPKQARPWIARAGASPLPFVVLLPLALLLLALLRWYWRRRGPPRTRAPKAPATPLTPARVEQWIGAGETRLVLDYLAWLVRDREDFHDWRARADAVRFTPGDEPSVIALAREGYQRWATRDGAPMPPARS